ncbi:histidine kinase, partial [Lactobacillus sp. XV13L]|nr:histidine kinase [Lactobacillus sp. XV13L]
KKLFRQYVVTYYAFVAAGLLLLVRQVPLTVLATFITSSHHGDLITSLVFLLFVLLSPLGGRSIRNTYVRSGILKQQNKRYEMLIRRGERDRIARDLHDTLGQSFATITLKTELACKLLTRDPVAVKQQLVEIQAASRGNLTLVREIVTDLRQVTLTEVLVNLTDKLAGLN